MVEVNRIGNYGYYPQATSFTAQRREYRGIEDFKPGLYDPEQREKAEKKSSNLLKLTALTVAGIGAYLFFAKTGKGKALWNKITSFFRKTPTAQATQGAQATQATQAAQTAATTTATNATTKGAKPHRVRKPKAQKAIVAENAELLPNQKVKIKNGGGKEAVHKVRRNEKKITNETLMNEKNNAVTTKDLDNWQASLGKQATPEETVLINNNNKPATTSLADVMQEQGIQRTKNSSGRIVLEQTQKAPKTKAPATPVPAVPVADNATKIAEIEAKIAQNNKTIKMWKGMRTSHLEQENAKLLKELDALKGNTPAAVSKPVKPVAEVAPNTKAAQIEEAWAQYTSKPAAAVPETKAPTLAEKFAQVDAEAAKMAQEEAEALAKMGISL